MKRMISVACWQPASNAPQMTLRRSRKQVSDPFRARPQHFEPGSARSESGFRTRSASQQSLAGQETRKSTR